MSITAADHLPPTFMGYPRADGRAGIRNHVLVLSTVALTVRLAALAADGLDGVVPVVGDFCRGLQGPDADSQADVLARLVTHPNVGAALVLTFDRAAAQAVEARLADAGRPVIIQAMMDATGMQHAVWRARDALTGLVSGTLQAERTPCDLASLTVALECGGSDTTSALAANPVIGHLVDALVAAGGRAIVSETAEFIGAEQAVRQRAARPETAEAILVRVAAKEIMMAADGQDYRGVNPTRENIEAGLTTLAEKSMGAVAKTGSTPFVGCLDFAEAPTGPGLHFMDTPFFSPVSLTGMVAAGAQVILFALGVFNPSGNPLAPTIKICGNPQTLRDWSDAVDVDVSRVITDGARPDALAGPAGAVLADVLNGGETRAEHWREGQIIVPTHHPLL